MVAAGLLAAGGFLSAGMEGSFAPVARNLSLSGAAALGVLGLVGCLVAVAAATPAWSRPARVAALVGVAIGLPVTAAAALLTGFAAVAATALVLGWIVLGVAALLPTDPDPAARATSPGIPARLGLRWTSAIAALAVLGATAVGVLHVLVWNPIAKVPGRGLDEIYATMVALGESPAWPVAMVAVWASGWLALAVVFLLVAVIGRRGILSRFDARRVARTALVAIAGIGLGSWVAGFGMGMSIADAFLTTGGDGSGSGAVLIGIGVVAGVLAAVRIIAPTRRVRAAESG